MPETRSIAKFVLGVAQRQPMRSISGRYYRLLLAIARTALRNGPAAAGAVYRSDPKHPQFKPGLSDIDVLLILRDLPPASEFAPRELLRRRIGALVRLPLLSSVAPVTREELAAGTCQEAVYHERLRDGAVLWGQGLPAFPPQARDRAQLTAAAVAAWNYYVDFSRWLFDALPAPSITNYQKCFVKILACSGMQVPEAEARVVGALGARAMRRECLDARGALAPEPGRIEEVFVSLSECLRSRLAEIVEGAAGRLAGGRSIQVAAQARAPDPEWMSRLRSGLSARLPDAELLLCGSADGPGSGGLFVVLPDGRLDVAAAQSLRRWWADADTPAARSELEPLLRHPIISDRRSIGALLALDITRKLSCLSSGSAGGAVRAQPGLDWELLRLEATHASSFNSELRLLDPGPFRSLILQRLPRLLLLLRGRPYEESSDSSLNLELELPELAGIYSELTGLCSKSARICAGERERLWRLLRPILEAIRSELRTEKTG